MATFFFIRQLPKALYITFSPKLVTIASLVPILIAGITCTPGVNSIGYCIVIAPEVAVPGEVIEILQRPAPLRAVSFIPSLAHSGASESKVRTAPAAEVAAIVAGVRYASLIGIEVLKVTPLSVATIESLGSAGAADVNLKLIGKN